MGEWEGEGRRAPETFRRIHRLYKAGFRPDWSIVDVEDAIWWQHLGGHPELILYPDGKLVASLGKATLDPSSAFDPDRIYNMEAADAARFDDWLQTVKRPTWWQAGAAVRERYVLMPATSVGLCGLMILIAWGIERLACAAWHALTG